MHKENFVVSIKSGGKFLSEKKGEVLLPFLSEYSIFLKNKNSKRASVCVEIDGKDVLNGERITINPGESFDLERFFDDDDGRKFRFIEKRKAIIDHLGNQPEDGLIRVSFKYEKIKSYLNQGPYITRNPFPGGPTCNGGGLLRNDVLDGGAPFDLISYNKGILRDVLDGSPIVSNCGCSGSGAFDLVKLFGFDGGVEETSGFAEASLKISGVDSLYVPPIPSISEVWSEQSHMVSYSRSREPKEGITVKGSPSTQTLKKTFYIDTYGSEEFVIMLKLSGVDKNDITVEKPVLKDSKKECTSCGKKWDYSFTYCPDDATYLNQSI